MIDPEYKKHIVSELERIFSDRESLATYKDSIKERLATLKNADAYFMDLLKLSNLFDNYCLSSTKDNYTLLYSQIKKCELSVKWMNRILNGLGIDVPSTFSEDEEEDEMFQMDDDITAGAPLPDVKEQETFSTATKFCRQCGAKINISVHYCSACGLVQKMKECWICKREIPQNAFYCPFCNAKNNMDKLIK